MATHFKLRYSGTVIPTEEVTLSDGTDVSYNINSNLDKTFGGSFVQDTGVSSAKVVRKAYLTTTSYVALSDATILDSSTALSFIFIKIVSAGSTGTPSALISFSGFAGGGITLSGIGDFCLIPCSLYPALLEIASIGATTVANVEILVGTL